MQGERRFMSTTDLFLSPEVMCERDDQGAEGDRENMGCAPAGDAGLSFCKSVPLVAAPWPYWEHTVQLAFRSGTWTTLG
jgi:hypothetical protein